MELYILSKQDLSILSICKLADYQINLDEETNAKSTFTLMKTNGLKKENYMVLNGLYRQFIFVIDDVQTEKDSDVVTVTALDISNIFDRKVIEKNIDIMKSKSIEEFLANTISADFVNSDDTALNVNYIEIYWHTNTQGNVATNAENGLYNFHTFLTNCRQYKNIYTDFKLENLGNPQTVEGKRINVEAKNRKIVDISLHGESTQKTRSGKNFFDKTKFKAINNATYTYSNGIYAITPLGTANVSLDIYINLPAGIYTYSGNGSNATQVKNSSGTTIANNVSSSNTTFTITEEGTYIRFNWGTGTSTDAFTLDTNNIQIEIGSTATDYEEYGVMPSPDYPSEIENVEGKNIWNKSEISEKTSTVNTVVGELNVKDVPIPFTFSSYLISNALTDTNVRVSFIDSNNSNIGAVKFGNTVTSTNKRSSITINEIPEGAVKIRFGIRMQDGGHTEKTQLEAGTVATPYVPYNSLEFKVEGKNRFDKEASYIFKTNNVDKIVLDTGVRIQSTATYTTNATNFYVVKLGNITDYLGKTIRIKTTALLSSDTLKAMFYLGTCTDDGTSRKSMKTGNLAKGVSGEIFVSTTISSEQGDMYDNLMIALYSTGGTPISSGDYIDYNELIVTADDEDMTYEPYKSQVVYIPLTEGQKLMEGNYLADDGVNNKRKQYVFKGTENFIVQRQTNDTDLYIAHNLSGLKTRGNLLSNYFLQGLRLGENTNKIGAFYSTYLYFGIPLSTIGATSSDNNNVKTQKFKEWLATQYANGTPVIVEYELAEPEIVPYTEEQQEAWNNIKNLTLFEGVNHISSNANMVLKYYPLKPVGLKFILRIDIENKQDTTELIDTTLPEVADYNKIYEEDVTAKVQVYIREDGSEYNLYLKTDRTTTTNKDDPDRASGKIEVISVETADKAEEEALNVMKGNNYKHLVEFKIAKTSKLMDITELHIGRPIRIKTDDDIYDSYISAITLSDENFVYFKSGSLRITLLDKLKKTSNTVGDKLDRTGGKITGNLDISGTLKENGKTLLDLTYPVGSIFMSINSSNPSILFGRNMGSLGCW